MKKVVNSRTISKQNVRWRYYAIWNANIICIRASKDRELTDREGLRKVNYKKGNVKQQISSVVRSCLRNYKCSSYGEFRTLLEAFNVSVEERTGTIDERNYAGIVYGAMTDDGYGIGTPFKSSRIGRDVGYKALQKYYERSKRR